MTFAAAGAATALRVPAFRSAFLEGGPGGGALPPRRFGRTVLLSIAAHAAFGATLVVLSLMVLDPIPEPSITIRFVAMPPIAPRVAPLREEEKRPEPKPVAPPPRREAPVPALAVPPPPPPPAMARPRPEPQPIRVEPAALPARVADAVPEVHLRDSAPAARTAPAIGRVAAAPSLPSGTGEASELVFLVPGQGRPRGPGGGIAGEGDGLPTLPAAALDGDAGGGRAGRAGTGEDLPAPGGSFAGTGIASFLAQKYGVPLVEAARLGSRTSDGARYNILVPMLSEIYGRVDRRGAWRPAAGDGDGVASISADGDAIAIRYRDGTLHVIVPTRDGLVALFVSAAGPGPATRSKVDEAERALAALQHLMKVRG